MPAWSLLHTDSQWAVESKDD